MRHMFCRTGRRGPCGWFILRAPAIKSRKIEIDWSRRTVCSGNISGPNKVLTKVWLVLPDGSEIEMRDRASQGEPNPVDVYPDCTAVNTTDRDRGRIWYSTDGSAITYVTDEDNGVVLNHFAGYVFLSDGTRMRIRNDGSCADIIDRNGDFVHIAYNSPVTGSVTYTDQLGRQVILQPFTEPDGVSTGATVTIKGYSPTADRVIQVDAAKLGAPDGFGTLDTDHQRGF